MTNWDHETDLVVVGSGGGGMTAALTAKLEGLDSIVLEKTKYFGGSTAISGTTACRTRSSGTSICSMNSRKACSSMSLMRETAA